MSNLRWFGAFVLFIVIVILMTACVPATVLCKAHDGSVLFQGHVTDAIPLRGGGFQLRTSNGLVYVTGDCVVTHE